MSDAGHNLVDQARSFLPLYAHLLTARLPRNRTFGYHRAGIIAAFLEFVRPVNHSPRITLVGLKRLLQPIPVDGGWIMAIAAEFRSQSEYRTLCSTEPRMILNIRSAFWHMLGDAWASLGVRDQRRGHTIHRMDHLDPLISLLASWQLQKGLGAV